MKIGMLVYSETGNTLAAAGEVADALVRAGHTVSVEALCDQVPPGSPRLSSPGTAVALRKPDLSGYDAYVFASCVQAFSLPPSMAAWLAGLPGMAGPDGKPGLGGRPVACFVTKRLPWGWTGGTRALSMMESAVKAAGGRPGAAGFIPMGSRAAATEKVAADLVSAFGRGGK